MNISKTWLVTSIIIGALSLYASLSGLFQPLTYSRETANWILQALGQDVGNLLAIPALLISSYLLFKKSDKSFLIWLGVLIYFIYAYLVYAFFIHFNFLFLVYVTILGLSTYTLIGGLLQQDKSLGHLSIKSGKPAGFLLILIGILFGFLWLSEILSALLSQQDPKSIVIVGLWVNPIHVIDLSLVLPGMIITGVMLIRKKSLGYLFAAPWLTFSILMGSGIVANMVFEIMRGNNEAIVPLVLVGAVVAASLASLIHYVKQV